MDEARESIANISIKCNPRGANYHHQSKTGGQGNTSVNASGRGGEGRGGLTFGGHDIRAGYQSNVNSSPPQFYNMNHTNSQAQSKRQLYGCSQSNSQQSNFHLYQDRVGYFQPMQYNFQNPDYSYASQSYSRSPRVHIPSPYSVGSSGDTLGIASNSRNSQNSKDSITPQSNRSGQSSDHLTDKFYSQSNSQSKHMHTIEGSDEFNIIDNHTKLTGENNTANGNHTEDEHINGEHNGTYPIRTTSIPYDPSKYTSTNNRPNPHLPPAVSLVHVENAIQLIEGLEQATLSPNGVALRSNGSISEPKPVLSVITDMETNQVDTINELVSNDSSTAASNRSNNIQHQVLGRNIQQATYSTKSSNLQHQTQQFTHMYHYHGATQVTTGAYNRTCR